MVTLVGWNDGGGYDCDERRRRRSSVARVREPEKREEGMRESESDPGGCVASPGVEEEAGGGRGLSGARHASPLFVLLAQEEDDKGEEVGWAGQMELGQVSGAR